MGLKFSTLIPYHSFYVRTHRIGEKIQDCNRPCCLNAGYGMNESKQGSDRTFKNEKTMILKNFKYQYFRISVVSFNTSFSVKHAHMPKKWSFNLRKQDKQCLALIFAFFTHFLTWDTDFFQRERSLWSKS